MRKSWALAVVVFLGVSVAGGFLLTAGAAPTANGRPNAWARAHAVAPTLAPQSHEGGQDIRLTARETNFKFINVDGPRQGPGDYFVLREALFRGGRRVGHDNVRCTLSFPFGPAVFTAQCEATFTLPRGQISVAGTLRFTEASATETIPITGGSDHYQNVRGQLRFTDTGFILELIP